MGANLATKHLLIGLTVTFLLTGCAAGVTPSPSATAAATPAVAVATSTSTPTLSPTLGTPVQPAGPGLVAQGTLDDPVDDLVDGHAKPVGTPAHMDIRTLAAVADGTTLRLTLTLAGVLPAAPSPTIERLVYLVALHTDGDALPERDDARVGIGYWILLSNPVAGAYEAALRDWSVWPEQIGYIGSDFPGTADVASDTVVLTVPLAALGDPYVIRIGVWTMRQDPARGRLTNAEDFLPDSGADGLATRDWITLGP